MMVTSPPGIDSNCKNLSEEREELKRINDGKLNEFHENYSSNHSQKENKSNTEQMWVKWVLQVLCRQYERS